MNRAALGLSASLAALGAIGGANAQDLRELQTRNAAAHALEDLRRDALSSQIDASNAQERARTQILLRRLDAGASTAPLGLRPLAVPPARVVEDLPQHQADLSVAMDRLERLTQEALVQSNARMRAIKPASEPN